MATITGATNEKIYGVNRWFGLNEHPDGDTRLKFGEASKMVNWKITRDGNLKRRPGTEFVIGLCSSYSVAIGTTLYRLATLTADDEIVYSTEASAMAPPGTVTLVGASGSIEQGVYSIPGADVQEGVLEFSEDFDVDITDGVLTASSEAKAVKLSQLPEILQALADGEFIYIIFEEVAYALNSSCLTISGEDYILSGYRATAEPDAAAPIVGMWTGLCGGRKVFLAACANSIWNLYDEDTGTLTREFLGTVLTDKGVSFFPFDGKVYILNGHEYYFYDGDTLAPVEGYRPLVAVSISPDLGGGSESGETTGEYVNRLNGKRRVWISPDGENATFAMPETNLASIDWVKDLSTNTTLEDGYSYDLSAGTVTFTTVPAKGVNSYEIAYSVATTYRNQVTGNLYAEIFAGNTDTGVFIYGDGTNRALYTGMDYDGIARADYFPDQYEVHVGDSNTPITSMVRHYGVLMCYKTDSAWALSYSTTELATGDATIAIYCTPVNRDKGNLAPGQVCLVDNSPVTCSGTELYRWTNSSYYTSNLTRDERQAVRISDRVQKSINDLDLLNACMWDDNDNQEFYIVSNKIALVWNYALDCWYRYENFDAVKMCSFNGEVYLGTSDGKIRRVTDRKMGDEGVAVEAVWESGNMDFGAGYMRKYAAMLWVGLKPESGTSVNVCVETDRKNTFREKVVSSEKAKISGQPFMVKTKLKAKKFVYYKLILSVEEKMPPVTVTDIEIRVRQTGYAK